MRALALALVALSLCCTAAAPSARAEVRSAEPPPAIPGGALSANGSYDLTCWQGGDKVVATSGRGEVLLPTPAADGTLLVKTADGGRLLILMAGESLCRVVSRPSAATP
jgi:hypothetical protein